MQIRVVVKFDEKTGSYDALCPELPGCICYADSEEAVCKKIKEAVEIYLSPDKRYPIPKKSHVINIDI